MYIRKLSKNSNLNKLQEDKEVGQLDADILKQELATKNNTLSFWKCESPQDIDDTIKAILLSTTSIESSRFIILEDKLLEKYDIDVDGEQMGQTGYKGRENLHVDFCNLTYEKIGRVLEMMKEASVNEDCVPKLQKGDVKRYIKEVIEAGLLNRDGLTDELRDRIDKYID